MSNAEKLACATTPAPRMVQRYLTSRPAGVQLFQLPHLVRVRALVVLSGHLEQRRESLEPRVREEDAELFAEQALLDVRVPVAVRAERRRGVVHVQRAQPVEPDPAVEVVDELVERLARGHVYSGHVEVA